MIIGNMKNNHQYWTLWAFVIACLIVSMTLVSCSADYHLNRALKKNPDILKADTVKRIDTVTTKEVYKDSIFKLTHTSDTVILKQDRLTVKHFYNYHDSTVYIQGECAKDTFYLESESVTIVQEPEWLIDIKYYLSYWWVVLILAIGILILRFYKKVGI